MRSMLDLTPMINVCRDWSDLIHSASSARNCIAICTGLLVVGTQGLNSTQLDASREAIRRKFKYMTLTKISCLYGALHTALYRTEKKNRLSLNRVVAVAWEMSVKMT